MDVDTVPVIADTSAEPHRMQRKLVSKTYVNEDGYMGTASIKANWYCSLLTDSELMNVRLVLMYKLLFCVMF